MQAFSKKKYLYFIAFMLMASTFLPLIFNNLPSLVRSHHIWTVLWGLSLLVLHPKIFLCKVIQYVLLYGIFLFIAIKIICINMDEWNQSMLLNEYYQIAVGVSVINYFYESKDYLGLAKLTKWTIVFLLVTAVMTIISSAIDPMYARNIVSISTVDIESEKEAILGFKFLGGGNYSTAIVFACLFPLSIYYFKNFNQSIISKRIIIVIVILLFFALLGMQIFANILVTIIFSLLAIIGMKKIKPSILIISIFALALAFIPKDFYVNSLISISDYLEEDSELNNKVIDLALFINTGADLEDVKSGTAQRAERYPMLWESFKKSPILGCYFNSDQSNNGYDVNGAHLHWMNKITTTGIIGLLFFLSIPYFHLKKHLQRFNTKYKFYFLLASLSILSYGFLKTISGREAWYAFFIIIPGLYYLPLLKKKNPL